MEVECKTKKNEINKEQKKIKKVIAWIAFVSLLVLYLHYMYQSHQIDENVIDFLDTYEEFDSYENVSNEPVTFKVQKDGSEVGYLVFGKEVGYQSTIIIATLVDLDGIIINSKTYSQDETPSFYNKLINKKFFDQFEGKSISEGVKINTNIDAITRATISSNAATKAIHEGINYVGQTHLGKEGQNLYTGVNFGSMEIAIIILLLLVILAYKTKNKQLRTLVLIYSVIIIGFKFSLFISYSLFFSFITGNFPSFTSDLKRYLLFFGALAFILTTGKNLYCTYMCPFGAIQELENKFAKLNFFKVSPKTKKILNVVPGFIAYFALVIAFTTNQTGALSYEPFSLLYGRVGLDIQWLLLPITLFMGLIVMRFYCNFGCPVGFTLNIFLKARRKVVSLWKRK